MCRARWTFGPPVTAPLRRGGGQGHQVLQPHPCSHLSSGSVLVRMQAAVLLVASVTPLPRFSLQAKLLGTGKPLFPDASKCVWKSDKGFSRGDAKTSYDRVAARGISEYGPAWLMAVKKNFFFLIKII